MATNPRRRWMSFEAYLLLDQNSPNVKYEYIDGYVVAMAGGTLDHSILAANMIALLKQTLGLKGTMSRPPIGCARQNQRNELSPRCYCKLRRC